MKEQAYSFEKEYEHEIELLYDVVEEFFWNPGRGLA
jgi:hypothetical protein